MVAPRTALRLATAACAAGSLLLLFYYSDQTEHHAAVLDVGQLKAVMTAFWQRHRCTTYFANWQAAVTRAARDSAQATRSNATALFLTLQPAVWLLFWLARLVLKDVLYDVVICRGICSERAVRQVKRAVVRAVEWQLSRTRRQVAWEVGLLAAAAALVQFHRFLQRRRFGARLRRRARAARKSVSKSYSTALQRLAATSRWLAIMFPYACLAASAVALKLAFPSALRWLACETQLVNGLSHLFPLVCSILLLHDALQLKQRQQQKKQQKDKKLKDVTNAAAAASPVGAASPKSKRALGKLKKDRHRRAPEHQQAKEKQLAAAAREHHHHRYWIHYWMVAATVWALHRLWRAVPLLSTVTPLWVATACVQVHLVFWVAVNAAPYMTPASLAAPDPVDWLAQNLIAPSCAVVYKGLSGLVPLDKWETYVCLPADKFLQMITWSKLLSEPHADALRHIVKESRGLLVPGLTIFSWPIQAYGLLYVQYVLPLALSSSSSKTSHERWLQFWVVHCVVSVTVNLFGSLLWWIPFSNVALFCVWAALATATPAQMESTYRNYVQREMQALGVLPPFHDEGEEDLTTEHSKAVQGFLWLVARLPRAADAATNNNNDAESNDAKQQQAPMINNGTSATPSDVQEDDDDESYNEGGEGHASASAQSGETIRGKENGRAIQAPVRHNSRRRSAATTTGNRDGGGDD